MQSLFVRIFVLFLMAMAFIVGGSIAVTYLVSAREYGPPEMTHGSSVAMQASEVLAKGGVGALQGWLRANRKAIPDREVFIVGPDGKDILDRRLPEMAARRLQGMPRDLPNGSGPPSGDPREQPHNFRPPPGNFRAPHFAPQIVGPDGSTYSVLLEPRRPSVFGALSLPGISLAILVIALAVSTFASWWLARHLSAPIRRIQQGARALAAETLDVPAQHVRVSAGLEDRRDEVAVLARDFDAMADQLRANRDATTRLLRDISHELRSPLARMRVALGLARQPSGNSERQLARLESEVERLDGLINQILKLARLHGTEAPFERDAVDLDEVVEQVVSDATYEGAAKNCRVVLSGAAHCLLYGNRELLSSAIENVLRNAVRYSPPECAVDVTVAREAPAAGAGTVSVTVRDRGPGVPEAELARIFEPFYRTAESRDRGSGGEGIGLAITSQVMKAHGGKATARNCADGGLEVKLSMGVRSVQPVSRGV
jgi:two-component system sensor histidine kinase CpxA